MIDTSTFSKDMANGRLANLWAAGFLFTTGFLEAGYRRFLERRLREDFDFAGSPIEISVRVREREKRK